MVGDSVIVIAGAVEPRGDSAEVADGGEDDCDELIEEIPHVRAAQGHLDAVGLAFAQLEVGDALAGLGDDGLLPRDLGDFLDDFLHPFFGHLAAYAGADYYLLQIGHHVGIVDAEGLFELGNDLFLVYFFKCWYAHFSLCFGLRLRLGLLGVVAPGRHYV